MSHSCVKFIENNTQKMMSVPSNWVIGKNVYWPKNNQKRHFDACSDPHENWTEIPIQKKIFRGIYFVKQLMIFLDL